MLHYQCASHGYMGNALIINSNVVNSPYAAIIRNGLDVLSGNVDISSNLNVTGNLDVDGNTTLDVTTIDGLLDINAGGQANTFKVEDLTSGRVVTVGTGGELQDSGNLLFNGTDLSAASLIVSDLTSGRVLLAGGSGAVEDNANLKFNTTTSEFEVVGHAVLDTVVASGIITASSFSGDGSNLSGIDASALKFGGAVKAQASATGVTITGNLGVSGALTYEDVTNVDSIGIITARSGVNVTGGNVTIANNIDVSGLAGIGSLTVAGVSTFSDNIHVKSADDTLALFESTDSLAQIQFKDNSSNANLPTLGVEVNSFYFNNMGSTTLRIAPGKVGVNEVTPLADFHVNQNEAHSSTFYLDSDAGALIENINAAATRKSVLKLVGDSAIVYGGSGNGSLIFSQRETEAASFDPSGTFSLVQGLNVAGVTTSTGGFVGNLTGTATLATDLAINGTNQLLYQDSNNDTAILPTGSAGQILQSNGAGAEPQWVTSAPAGAIEGITIRDESSIVGTANSISTINFVGSNVTADAAALAGISTVQIDHMTIQDEGSVVGTAGSISTLNFVGAGIAAAVSGGTATITAAGGATTDDVVALAIALG